MTFTVDKTWLIENLKNEEIVVVDCRFELSNPAMGNKLYLDSHIPGAVYFDLEKDLSSPVSRHGGRHPLPEINRFKSVIELAGIDQNKMVIAYDDGSCQFASRLWWLLTYTRHEKVSVLNEGFGGWVKAGYPVTKDIPEPIAANHEIHIQEEMLASYEEVQEIVVKKKKSPILIDSRSTDRYLGKTEPIDRIAGHIPGAINKFWEEGLNQGSFKNAQEQKTRFSEIDQDESIIVYCGSGVSATPNYIALKLAGYRHVKLYAGSYSDWISYEDNPVE